MKLEMEHAIGKTLPDAERNLARVLARHCRGNTVLVGEARPEFERELRERGAELSRHDRGDKPASAALAARDETFDTVLLLGVLEGRPEADRAERIDAAWRMVGPDGRLVVCVANGDLARNPSAPSLNRRELKRLLRRIDRPKPIKDQPLRWVAMCVDARPRIDRATRERHGVIAGLCRGRVLELGCNYGHLCDAVARRGLRVEGLDKSALKVERARRLFPDIPFRQADILELDADPRHDTVILSEVLEHVPAATGDRMLERAWSAVAENGRLIVSVPNENCVPHANHLREFCLDDLTRILGRFGEPRVVDEQPFKWLLMYVERC